MVQHHRSPSATTSHKHAGVWTGPARGRRGASPLLHTQEEWLMNANVLAVMLICPRWSRRGGSVSLRTTQDEMMFHQHGRSGDFVSLRQLEDEIVIHWYEHSGGFVSLRPLGFDRASYIDESQTVRSSRYDWIIRLKIKSFNTQTPAYGFISCFRTSDR